MASQNLKSREHGSVLYDGKTITCRFRPTSPIPLVRLTYMLKSAMSKLEGGNRNPANTGKIRSAQLEKMYLKAFRKISNLKPSSFIEFGQVNE